MLFISNYRQKIKKSFCLRFNFFKAIFRKELILVFPSLYIQFLHEIKYDVIEGKLAFKLLSINFYNFHVQRKTKIPRCL